MTNKKASSFAEFCGHDWNKAEYIVKTLANRLGIGYENLTYDLKRIGKKKIEKNSKKRKYN